MGKRGDWHFFLGGFLGGSLSAAFTGVFFLLFIAFLKGVDFQLVLTRALSVCFTILEVSFIHSL